METSDSRDALFSRMVDDAVKILAPEPPQSDVRAYFRWLISDRVYAVVILHLIWYETLFQIWGIQDALTQWREETSKQ